MANQTLGRKGGPSQSTHFLYRHFDSAGALLYVGVTNDMKRRNMEHATVSPWISRVASVTVDEYPNRAEAIAAEKAAVLAEKPEINTVWRPNMAEPGKKPTMAQHKAAERQRKREAGLVPVEVWVPKEAVEGLKAFSAAMCRPAEERPKLEIIGGAGSGRNPK